MQATTDFGQTDSTADSPASQQRRRSSLWQLDKARAAQTVHLELIARLVGADDRLAFALVCRSFRDALFLHCPPCPSGHEHAGKRIITREAACLMNVARAQWIADLEPDWEYWRRDALYTAAKVGSVKVLWWLLRQGCDFPPDLCDAAAYGGHMGAVEWCICAAVLPHGLICAAVLPPTGTTCGAAAAGGHLELLQYFRSIECDWDETTCSAASRNGHLAVLQWARAAGCPWDQNTCSAASRNGHLTVLQWARAAGCPWDKNTCFQAAANGHLDVLTWARTNGCAWADGNEFDLNPVCAGAARGGFLDVLIYLRANGCNCTLATCCLAAEGGHKEVVEWLVATGCCDWHSRIMASMAEHGHLALLKWARAAGCEFDQCICQSAADGGQLECLQWLRAQGCPWSSETTAAAAGGGHLECLRWLRAHGCPWTASTVQRACSHLELLQWARSHGCPWPDGPGANEFLAGAVESCRLDVLQYARQTGCPGWDDAIICYEAATQGELEILQFLHSVGVPWHDQTCERAAGPGTRLGQGFECLKFARAHGCPWNKVEVLQWRAIETRDWPPEWVLESPIDIWIAQQPE
eukprot:SAG31_NODE_2918_length_4914_cov_3.620145_5_plen_582_part_00